MNFPVTLDAQAKAPRASVGRQCATALFLRNLISEKDKQQVEEVISQAGAEPEASTNELSRLGLILEQNEAAVAQFIKRTVRAVKRTEASQSLPRLPAVRALQLLRR